MYLFTSESVSEGHPDKVADQISDAVLDELLSQDPSSKVACETLVTTGQVFVAGEVKSEGYVDLNEVVRRTIRRIGYTKSEYQFDADSCGILSAIHSQSPDINRGVERENPEEQGAGDQGMMFGYANNETDRYMPLPISLAHDILIVLAEIRREGKGMTYLRPDAKSQVTVEYDDQDRAQRIDTIVVSTQHDPNVTQEQIRQDVINILIPRVLAERVKTPEVKALFTKSEIKYFVNPTGQFIIGGPHGDTGLTEGEEVTHFGLWCMMSSPLLIGCDVRTISGFTMKLITNPYLVAMNQNRGLGVQGYVVQRAGEAYVIAKDADERFGTSRYVALYNAGDAEHEFCVKAAALELGGRIAAFDLVTRADIGEFSDRVFVKVPAHAARFYLMDAEKRVERTVYEAESAFLTAYQELKDAKEAKTPFYSQVVWASGGVAVKQLGGRADNDLIWKEVRLEKGGRRRLEFLCSSKEDTSFSVSIDGGAPVEVKVPASPETFASVGFEAELAAGIHTVRMFNPSAAMPDVDVMFIR